MPETLHCIKLSPIAQILKIVGAGYLVDFLSVFLRMIHAQNPTIRTLIATIHAALSRLATLLMTWSICEEGMRPILAATTLQSVIAGANHL